MRRELYPLDIHSEISMSSRTKSDGKNVLIRLILAGLAFIFAIGGNIFFGYVGIPFLGFVVGLLVGIFLAIFIWNRIAEKEEAQMENPDENKAMKFFRITLGREEYVGDIPVIEYSSGEKAIVLSLSMGNQTNAGCKLVEDFLDNLFHMCHKQKVKFKIFTTVEEWEDSEIHNKLLHTYGRIQDQKLKANMFESISVQGEEFSKSKVCQMNFIFIDREFDLSHLRTVIDYVESFRANTLKLSSVRSLRWNNQERAVRLFCRFLGIKLIDSSPLADKTQVYLDTKSLVRPFNPDMFFSSQKLTAHLTNTMATRIRTPQSKKRG